MIEIYSSKKSPDFSFEICLDFSEDFRNSSKKSLDFSFEICLHFSVDFRNSSEKSLDFSFEICLHFSVDFRNSSKKSLDFSFEICLDFSVKFSKVKFSKPCNFCSRCLEQNLKMIEIFDYPFSNFQNDRNLFIQKITRF